MPHGSGFCVSGFSMFILPCLVSMAFIKLAQTTFFQILIFTCTWVAQIALVFAFPSAATSETIGFAHRIRYEFPADQLRECADQLRQKYHAGTLVVGENTRNGHFFMEDASSVLVADGNLPVSLRGHFQQIFIDTDLSTGNEQVVFALGEENGIMCDSRKDLNGFYFRSIGNGVHVYRYERL